MIAAAATSVSAADARKRAIAAIEGVSGLATLPEVTTAIIRLVEDPRSDAAKLQKIVANDPALVSRVLKLVNSAFYGLPGKVTSIDRAIVMLGLNAVKNLAVAASLGQMFRGTKLCDGYTAKDLWTHCVAVAVLSRELAKQTRTPGSDEAFLGGMVHDIGLLVELQLWPEKLGAVCEEAKRGGSFVQIERERLGTDHQEVGRALCEKWRFPQLCRLVVEAHHGAAANEPIVAMVAAADALICAEHIGFDLTRTRDAAAAEAYALDVGGPIGLNPALIAATKKRLPELLQAVSALTE